MYLDSANIKTSIFFFLKIYRDLFFSSVFLFLSSVHCTVNLYVYNCTEVMVQIS